MRLRPHFMAAALFWALSSPAQAADSRLLTRTYNPGDVVVVEGRANVQATIVFGDDEHIENVAIGDSTSWQVTPNKRANLLFVKPLSPKARTNMTVVTDRHLYVFDLVAGTSATPFYVLKFSYPNDAKPAGHLAGAMSADEARAAADPLAQIAQAGPAQLNFAWRSSGSRKLLPLRIYDDGDATYMSWPARTSIPAILTRNDKGQEGAVNYAVRGDVLVLDSVPGLIVLRAGRDMAILENAATPPLEASATTTGDPTEAPTASADAAQRKPEGQ